MPLGAFRLNSLARYIAAGAPVGGWNILYSSYDSVTKDISANETQPTGIFFKSDGTKMFICGNAQNAVLEYALSSAWDLSSASYDSEFYVGTQDLTPNDVFFKSDGLKMYVIGQGNDKVYQYSLSTAWDVSSASYSTEISVGSQDSAPQSVFFKSDGSKMYALGTTNDSVFQYSLSTAWDVSSASYDSVSFSVSSQETSPTAMSFKPDGTRMYIAGSENDTIYEYTLSTPWDLSTASYDSVSFGVGSQSPTPTGIFFKPDGTKFYVVDSGISPAVDAVYQYTINETAPGVTLDAVSFDSNDYYGDAFPTYNASTSSDFVKGYKITASAWFKLPNLSNRKTIYTLRTNRAPILFCVNTDGTIRLLAGDQSVYICNTTTPIGDAVSTGVWNHVVWSMDTSDTNKRWVYINGQQISPSWTTNSSGYFLNTSYSVGSGICFNADGGGIEADVELAQIFIDNDYYDISQSATLEKFYNNGPVDMGSDGTASGLNQPLIYHYGNTSSSPEFKTNRGRTGSNYISYTLSTGSDPADTTGPST